jgi:hypothetical protein
MEVPANYTDFINSYWLFEKRNKLSYALKEYLNGTLQGLGLPMLKGRRREVWGYTDHPTLNYVLLPIEADLKTMFRALKMDESGEYYLKDIWDWANSCNLKAPLTKDIWYEYINQKQLFDEFVKPFEYKISILADGKLIPTPSKKEAAESSSDEGREKAV